MKYKLADEDAYIEGRSPQKARELIAAAEEAGIDPALVRTTSGGYIVPKELGGEGGDTNLLEVGHGLNTQKYVDGIDDEQVQATVGTALLEAIQPVADAGAVEGAILNQSKPTGAKTEGTAIGNGSQTVGDSAVLTQDREATDPAHRVVAEEGDFTEEEKTEEVPSTTEPEKEESVEASNVNEAFDPADHNVADVNEYLAAADEDERQRVLALEATGKDRKTIAVPEEGK